MNSIRMYKKTGIESSQKDKEIPFSIFSIAWTMIPSPFSKSVSVDLFSVERFSISTRPFRFDVLSYACPTPFMKSFYVWS
jgi:hypothetical protein